MLKRIIGKLLGDHMMSKQEIPHLKLVLLLVYYSHQFINTNLDNDFRLICMKISASVSETDKGIEGL